MGVHVPYKCCTCIVQRHVLALGVKSVTNAYKRLGRHILRRRYLKPHFATKRPRTRPSGTRRHCDGAFDANMSNRTAHCKRNVAYGALQPCSLHYMAILALDLASPGACAMLVHGRTSALGVTWRLDACAMLVHGRTGALGVTWRLLDTCAILVRYLCGILYPARYIFNFIAEMFNSIERFVQIVH